MTFFFFFFFRNPGVQKEPKRHIYSKVKMKLSCSFVVLEKRQRMLCISHAGKLMNKSVFHRHKSGKNLLSLYDRDFMIETLRSHQIWQLNTKKKFLWNREEDIPTACSCLVRLNLFFSFSSHPSAQLLLAENLVHGDLIKHLQWFPHKCLQIKMIKLWHFRSKPTVAIPWWSVEPHLWPLFISVSQQRKDKRWPYFTFGQILRRWHWSWVFILKLWGPSSIDLLCCCCCECAFKRLLKPVFLFYPNMQISGLGEQGDVGDHGLSRWLAATG